MVLSVILDNYYTFGPDSIMNLLIPSQAVKNMPIETKEYVELHCQWTKIKLLPPLAFNIFLLTCSVILAFLTRHLPDAFNESWYMFLSVGATLLVWLAFLPTYFIVFYAYYKATVLSLALSFNAICNTSLLFMPKIYAIYWRKDRDICTSVYITKFKERLNSQAWESSVQDGPTVTDTSVGTYARESITNADNTKHALLQKHRLSNALAKKI